jgi:RHS repeat-associated protein
MVCISQCRYTGKERDSESGNDYFGARYYASSMGRFMSPDPGWFLSMDLTNPQSLNLYSYVLNNPLSFTDPSGMECVWDDGSFDSADDPQTGSAAGCSGQGGTYVNPDLFENAMLSTGQWNSNYGDWSSSANSGLQGWAAASGSSTPPAPGQDLGFDAQVAYDQAWLTARQPQSAPTPEQYLQAIAKATAPIPNVCSGGVTASLGKASLSASLGPGNAGYGGFQFSASFGDHTGGSSTSQNEGDMNYNSLFPTLPSPVNVHYSGGGNIVSANTSSNVNVKGRKIGVSGFINISNFGDPNCQ